MTIRAWMIARKPVWGLATKKGTYVLLRTYVPESIPPTELPYSMLRIRSRLVWRMLYLNVTIGVR